MELERDIYTDLLQWKKSHNKQVLLLVGARQVGKTYIIKKLQKSNINT